MLWRQGAQAAPLKFFRRIHGGINLAGCGQVFHMTFLQRFHREFAAAVFTDKSGRGRFETPRSEFARVQQSGQSLVNGQPDFPARCPPPDVAIALHHFARKVQQVQPIQLVSSSRNAGSSPIWLRGSPAFAHRAVGYWQTLALVCCCRRLKGSIARTIYVLIVIMGHWRPVKKQETRCCPNRERPSRPQQCENLRLSVRYSFSHHRDHFFMLIELGNTTGCPLKLDDYLSARNSLLELMKAIALLKAEKPSRQTGRPLPTVDQIMVEERAAFTKRSIKTSAKLAGLKMAVSMMDLTTLEGKDTPGKGGLSHCRRRSSRWKPDMLSLPAPFVFTRTWSGLRGVFLGDPSPSTSHPLPLVSPAARCARVWRKYDAR